MVIEITGSPLGSGEEGIIMRSAHAVFYSSFALVVLGCSPGAESSIEQPATGTSEQQGTAIDNSTQTRDVNQLIKNSGVACELLSYNGRFETRTGQINPFYGHESTSYVAIPEIRMDLPAITFGNGQPRQKRTFYARVSSYSTADPEGEAPVHMELFDAATDRLLVEEYFRVSVKDDSKSCVRLEYDLSRPDAIPVVATECRPYTSDRYVSFQCREYSLE